MSGFPVHRRGEVQDEVDRIVQSWQLERRDLNVEVMRISVRISRFAKHLERCRSQVLKDNDMLSWEFELLSVLRRAGAPYCLTTKSVQEEMMISSNTMAVRVNRMADSGLISRSRSKHDKRSGLITLTQLGLERIDRAIVQMLKADEKLIKHLSLFEREQLASLLRYLLLPFEGVAVRPRGY